VEGVAFVSGRGQGGQPSRYYKNEKDVNAQHWVKADQGLEKAGTWGHPNKKRRLTLV